MSQEFTSANTSVNSHKLPAIYNKINWHKIYENYSNHNVLDIGAGKYISHIQMFLNNEGFQYYPYDPYNQTDSINIEAMLCKPCAVICSNVLNVIKEREVIFSIHNQIRGYKVPFFITIYDGDKSWVGKPTQGNKSYQRNETIDSYLLRWDEIIFKQVITLPIYKDYLRR